MKAAEPAGIEDRMKEFGKQAQKDIDKYKSEINNTSFDLQRLEKQQERLSKQAEQIIDKESPKAKALSTRIQSAEDSAKTTSAKLQTAQYNLSYAQNELKLSKDKGAFTRHMQARASAAAMMSMNPDMEGSLTGHRVVVNSGHYKEDPKFPGFEKDDTAEWKMNLESEDVAGAMIKMAGGAVKLVNQADLKDKSMTGLANAIKAAKPEAAIGIHHDDGENPDDPLMKGTLTLQCAKTTGEWSLDFAKAVHMAKLNYVGLDDRHNSKGVSVGIREQCGRGVQGRNVDAPFILDEQASTHKDMWPLARDPKVNAEIQFSHVVSFYEFLNKKPRYKISEETGKEWKDKIWSKKDMDDVFSKHPKVGAW
jgi:N-acetylmuramoyl-L-alanine amidase